MQGKKGFTLIEIVIVIAIIGLLAAMALPRFQDLSGSAKQGSAKAGLGAVRSALAIGYAQSATGGAAAAYPTALDSSYFVGGLPTNNVNTFSGITALSTTTTGTATHGSVGYWYVSNSTAPDYGRAGAYSDGTVNTSSW